MAHGLLHGLLLDGNGGGTVIADTDLPKWTADSGDAWLHFDLEDEESLHWFEQHSGLDAVVTEALLEVESRPRSTRVGDGALLAFRGVNLNEGATPDDMIGIRLWVDSHRVVTTLRRPLRSVQDVETELKLGEGPKNATEVVTSIAGHLVARMTETIDNLEERIAELEEQALEAADQDTRAGLAELRRQIIALARYLKPQREALTSLTALKVPWMDESHRIQLREINDQLIRHLEDLDALRERAAVTQEELQARIAEQQNVRMYVLSIVAAIFLPLGFLTGLLGINVGGMPGADSPGAFTYVTIGMGLLLMGQLVFFRLRKWF